MKLPKILIFLVLASLSHISSFSQCAMCRATAETASESDSSIGTGLNSAIVYMMGAPYILLAMIAVVFWRKKILTFIRS